MSDLGRFAVCFGAIVVVMAPILGYFAWLVGIRGREWVRFFGFTYGLTALVYWLIVGLALALGP